MINQEEYEGLKEKMVWVRFCHADASVRAARDREHSRVEYEPILVKLSDAISLIEQPKEWETYAPELGVDSRCFNHRFATPGYPTVDRLQKGIIRELQGMGHDIYQRNAISYDEAHVKPLGEPELEVTAPLIEVWIGEYIHETQDLGSYTGKAYSEQQIKEAHLHVEEAIQKLGTREIVSAKVSNSFEEGNFEEIASTIGVEEGEIVLKRPVHKWRGEWTVGDLVIAQVVKTERGHFELQYPFAFPCFSADQTELKEAVETIGTSVLEHRGRSGFASRNSYIVRPTEKTTEYDIKVIQDIWPDAGVIRYMTEPDNVKTLDYCQEDVEKAYATVAKAKELIKSRRLERFSSKFQERSLDGIFSIVAEGGHEEKVEIPEGRFIECFRARTANTQDHRQNLTHTEDVGYIDAERVKQAVKDGKVHINIPEEYMGRMIGAKGSNIKRLQDTIQQLIGTSGEVRIVLHAKSKEEVEIRLTQIQETIKAQKAQSHDEQ